MSNGNSGTRRNFLKTAAVGSAMVPLVGTAIASEGETERKRDVSGYSLSASGSGDTTGDTISKEERERIRTLMTEIGDGDSTQTLQRSRETSDEASSMESETVDILQEDPTDAPGNQVWSESTSVSDTTVTGASLVDADYYMTCYKPAIYDEDGNRYLMWYAWGGLRPQDRAAWTGNLENARVEIELTSDNGDMVRYKPGGDRDRHGYEMDMSMEVSGEPGGVGGSATLSGSFTIGGGTVRPHRSKMDMGADTFCPAFEGQTEATCELLGMCVGKMDPSGGTVTWDWEVSVDGDRYNKCPVVC